MKKSCAKTKPASVYVVAVLCFLTATVGSAFAQGGDRRPSPVERREDISNRQAAEYEIEKSSRELKKVPERPADRKRAPEAAEQIKHDFDGLQESHNHIVLFMAEKEGLDRNYNSVLRAVAEIKKYATRLKNNLALPKAQQEKREVEARDDGNNQQIEASLLTLRKHIYDFVTNPLFETPGVLNLEQGRKAGLDLDRIIELSESITKSVDKLKQPAKP
ncbi:MAG TPA: hypothetical protein DC047_02710 [Blastocatellia bacterium]|nr:hypothetical protein [Blastocatellia bacterium]